MELAIGVSDWVTPVKFEPSPLKDVAVKIPVTTAPVFVACTFVAAPNFNAEASIPDNWDPSPLNDVAVMIPVATILRELISPVVIWSVEVKPTFPVLP